jgi:hypothetical protein
MRYFIAQNGSDVVEKQALEGDMDKIDSLVNEYRANHPQLILLEVDEKTFEATEMTIEQTKAQADWAAFKATSPTALQSILYLAKAIGLE